MPLVDHLALADVKNRLSEVVDRLDQPRTLASLV
jgi:hypothetical protein